MKKEFINNTTVLPPLMIRLPKSGQRCQISGLSRATLYVLITPSVFNGNNPPVKSVSLRTRGNIRGIRLISYESLQDYLNSQVLKAGGIS